MFSSFHPVSVQSWPPTSYQRGCLSSHNFSITEGLSTSNISKYWDRKLRKSENSELGSVILMGLFHKTAFRSKMTAPFAVLWLNVWYSMFSLKPWGFPDYFFSFSLYHFSDLCFLLLHLRMRESSHRILSVMVLKQLEDWWWLTSDTPHTLLTTQQAVHIALPTLTNVRDKQSGLVLDLQEIWHCTELCFQVSLSFSFQ